MMPSCLLRNINIVKQTQYIFAGMLLSISVAGLAAENSGDPSQSGELAGIKKRLDEEKRNLELEKLQKVILDQKKSLQAQWDQLQKLEKQLQTFSQQQPKQKQTPPTGKAATVASTQT